VGARKALTAGRRPLDTPRRCGEADDPPYGAKRPDRPFPSVGPSTPPGLRTEPSTPPRPVTAPRAWDGSTRRVFLFSRPDTTAWPHSGDASAASKDRNAPAGPRSPSRRIRDCATGPRRDDPRPVARSRRFAGLNDTVSPSENREPPSLPSAPGLREALRGSPDLAASVTSAGPQPRSCSRFFVSEVNAGVRPASRFQLPFATPRLLKREEKTKSRPSITTRPRPVVGVPGAPRLPWHSQTATIPCPCHREKRPSRPHTSGRTTSFAIAPSPAASPSLTISRRILAVPEPHQLVPATLASSGPMRATPPSRTGSFSPPRPR